MRVVAADRSSPVDREWLESRARCVLSSDWRGVKAVDASGRTRGLVAYDCWTPNSVQCHMAVDTPIAWRSLLGPASSYPFDEAGRGLLLAIIQGGNPESLRMTRRLGFTEAHRIRDGHAVGVDTHIFEMRREDCRWLAPAYRKAA